MNVFNFPKFFAHRGASGHAPENTLISFIKAAELGAQWVEFDVKLTYDEHVIVFHDDELSRLTTHQGRVSEMSLEQLKRVNIRYNNLISSERISTFQEIIACLAQYHLNANVELKPDKGQESLLAEKVWQDVQTYWPIHLQQPLFSSFNRQCLYKLRELNDSLHLARLLNRPTIRWQQEIFDLNCVSIHANDRFLTRQQIKEYKATGCYLAVFTVNDPKRMQMLYRRGIDAIFTDFPDRVIPIVPTD